MEQNWPTAFSLIDTNVLLSGLMFPEGTPGRIIAAWIENRFDVALSLDQLAKIRRVLEYPIETRAEFVRRFYQPQ